MTKEKIEAKIERVRRNLGYAALHSDGWWHCLRVISELVKEWRKISDLYEA